MTQAMTRKLPGCKWADGCKNRMVTIHWHHLRGELPVCRAHLTEWIKWNNVRCEWNVRCQNRSAYVRPHPNVGAVPVCSSCNALLHPSYPA